MANHLRSSNRTNDCVLGQYPKTFIPLVAPESHGLGRRSIQREPNQWPLKELDLHQLVKSRKMIDPHRLLQRWKGVSDQEAWAQKANSYLDCSAWGAPPWTADQWATLRVVMEVANE